MARAEFTPSGAFLEFFFKISTPVSFLSGKKGVEVIEDAPMDRIQRKILLFCGQMSSDLHYLLLPSEKEISNRAVTWDPNQKLEIEVPFPDLILPFRIDNLLPRVIELTLNATHRYVVF